MVNLEKATNSLGPVALAIVGLAVIVGVGTIVLTQMQPVSYADTDVSDAKFQPGTPFPTNVTVSEASNADFQGVEEDSEILVLEDSSAGTNTTLTAGTDYNNFYDEGKFELLNTSTTTDYDSTNDNVYVDYTHLSDSDATGVLSTGINSLQTFSDFFTVIIVIAIASVLFLMLRVVRGAGRGVTA